MSLTFELNAHEEELEEFLLSEHVKDTGIPVYPFSAVNCSIAAYNRSLGITNGSGTLFLDGYYATAYGHPNNFQPMLAALKRCNVISKFVW